VAFEVLTMSHPTLITTDFEAAKDWYARVFGRTPHRENYAAHLGRRAFWVHIADVNMENCVADPGCGSALDVFHRRFGEHLHSLAWNVREIEDLFRHLRAMGIRINRDDGTPSPDAVLSFGDGVAPDLLILFTHPRDTFGIHEFLENRTAPPPMTVIDECAPERDPLGIAGTSHHTMVVHDVDAAVRLFEEGFHGKLLGRADNPLLGTRSAYVWVGSENIIELAQPTVAGGAMDDRERFRDVYHSTTFVVRDLDAVRRHLAREGVGLESDSGDAILTKPADCLGARWGFAAARLACDPRG
jgi:catechol 2,3-dioxygenase-like lactoylglutathione lyase family enzyme